MDPTEWQVRTVLGDCISTARGHSPIPAPQCRQHALISDFLGLAHLSLREEAALATNWIEGPTRRVETTEPYVGHQDGADLQAVYQKI